MINFLNRLSGHYRRELGRLWKKNPRLPVPKFADTGLMWRETRDFMIVPGSAPTEFRDQYDTLMIEEEFVRRNVP